MSKKHPLDTIKELIQYCDRKFDRDENSDERKLLSEANLAYLGLNVATATLGGYGHKSELIQKVDPQKDL